MDHMDAYLSMIPKDEADLSKAVCALHSWHVCHMCILRFLGDTSQSSYRRTDDEQQKWMEQYLNCDGIVSEATNEAEDFICVACVGILQPIFCSETYYKKLELIVKKEDFEFDSYYLSLSIPVPLMLREYAVFLKLMELLPTVYDISVRDEITPIKEVWKWASGPNMSRLLDAPFDQKSLFEVKLNFGHPDLERECNFLLDLFPDVFCHRKNKKHSWETFTRVNVPNALNTMSEATFMKNYTCPPRLLSTACECTSVVCTHEVIFIAGRYNKYSRDLSQTPWIVDGGRRTESSIEEMLCIELKMVTQCDEYKLSASGREDVDVLMLGRGRPFLVEIINPRRIHFTVDDMKQTQDRINASHKEVRCRDLQVVSKEETKNLKAGEEEKVKVYSALCWSDKVITQELLDSKLNHLKDLVLKQKTPIRVLHRRALAVRDRTIHKITAKHRDDKHFFIYLSTQAGTYIKEFVHGDFGRTLPSLGHLLDSECDILELNVDCVELDWPPQLEQYDPEEENCPAAF